LTRDGSCGELASPAIQFEQALVPVQRVDLYQRCGALQYLCAWDVLRGIPWGRWEPKTGIAAFTRLVDHVMAMEPYRSAPRVFWIVDNGTSHQGHKAARRLQERYPNLILEVHTRQDFDQRLLELEPWIRQLAA
jgi:hypothetical protein